VGVVNVTKRKGAREKSVSKLNVRGHLGLLIWLISQFSRASSDFFCDCVILVLGSGQRLLPCWYLVVSNQTARSVRTYSRPEALDVISQTSTLIILCAWSDAEVRACRSFGEALDTMATGPLTTMGISIYSKQPSESVTTHFSISHFSFFYHGYLSMFL